MRAALGLLAAAALFAQPFRDLATTDDGATLYFASTLRLRGGALNENSKLFRWTPAGFALVEQRDTGERTGNTYENFYDLRSPRLSGDGTVLAFTAARSCYGGSGCLSVSRFQGTLRQRAAERRLTGYLDLSRNGRYVLSWGPQTMPVSPPYLLDLATGESFNLTAPSGVSGLNRVTNDGRVLLVSGPTLRLWSKDGSRDLSTRLPAASAIIDPTGSVVVYETQPQVSVTRLMKLDLATGAETELASGAGPFDPSLSHDGSSVAWIDDDLYVDGRKLTSEPAGVLEAVLSGDGRTVYAVSGAARLLRIGIPTGSTVELAPSTPYVVSTDRGLPPATRVAPAGGLFRLLGYGLSESVRINGAVTPPLYASPNDVRIDIPAELPYGRYAATMDSASPFELAMNIEVTRLDPQFYYMGERFDPVLIHDGFTGLISAENPARPSEVIIAYMSGLGPSVEGFTCRVGSAPVQVEWVGPIPGLNGVFQANIRMPAAFDGEFANLVCGFEPDFTSGVLLPLTATRAGSPASATTQGALTPRPHSSTQTHRRTSRRTSGPRDIRTEDAPTLPGIPAESAPLHRADSLRQ